LAPGAVIAVAIAGEARGWGLLNALALPLWVAVPAGMVLLDLAIYFQHVMFHAVPALWRLHRVHHADLDFDVTTGTRFHPLEILLSTGIKCAVVAASGAPAVSVLAFELLLNATAMFNHANASVAPGVERWLRWLLVTPDMHRVHHSVRYEESSSNFGFNLPLWDRIFGTYRAQPRAGHAAMTIGVDAFRSPEEMRLDRLLLQPFLVDRLESPDDHRVHQRFLGMKVIVDRRQIVQAHRDFIMSLAQLLFHDVQRAVVQLLCFVEFFFIRQDAHKAFQISQRFRILISFLSR